MADSRRPASSSTCGRSRWRKGSQAWLKMLGTAGGSRSTRRPSGAPSWIRAWPAWSKVMTQGTASPDLMAQWKQFLDQWIAAWSKVLEQAMGTEAFAKTIGKQIEGFLSTQPAR